MIVVVGTPDTRAGPSGIELAGATALVAQAAAQRGARVEVVGRLGDNPDGDNVALALARAKVGHAALRRDAGTPTSRDGGAADEGLARGADVGGGKQLSTELEPEDVDLALRYLGDISVIVVTEPQPPAVLRVVASAADYAGAQLVIVSDRDAPATDDAIVLRPPRSDPDGTFAHFLGTFTADLDSGAEVKSAFEAATARQGWSRRVDT